MKLFSLIFLVGQIAFASFKPIPLSDVTVSSAGTRVAITSSAIYAPVVCVQGHASNTGVIYVGDSSVSSTKGISLSAGQSACFDQSDVPGFDIIDLRTIYVDAATNGDKAKVIYTAPN